MGWEVRNTRCRGVIDDRRRELGGREGGCGRFSEGGDVLSVRGTVICLFEAQCDNWWLVE